MWLAGGRWLGRNEDVDRSEHPDSRWRSRWSSGSSAGSSPQGKHGRAQAVALHNGRVDGSIALVPGVICIGIGLLGRAGWLPRNRWAGIRMRSTLRSPEAWVTGHRAAWIHTVAAGVVYFIFGLWELLGSAPGWFGTASVATGTAVLVFAGVVAYLAAASADTTS